MRSKLFLIGLVLILFAPTVLADSFIIEDTSGNPLFTANATSQNVGVGTLLPSEKLVVVGNVNVSGTLNVSGRVAFPNLASCDTIDTDANGVLTCGTDDGGAGGNNNSLWNESGTNIFPSDINKILGIGTASPNAGLGIHSVGDIYTEGDIHTDTIDSNYIADSRQLLLAAGDVSGAIQLEAGGTERMRIAATGFVGINTTSPGAMLDINASEDSEFIRLTDDTNSDHVGIYSGAGSPEGVVAAQIGSLYMDNSGGSLYKKEQDGGTAGWFEVQSFNGSNQHMAKMTRASAQTVSSAIWTGIEFDAVNFSTGIITDTDNGSINITKSGTYLVSVGWSEVVGANRHNIVAIHLNGASIRAQNHHSDTAGWYTGNELTDVLKLTSGDVLHMFVYQDSGGDINTDTLVSERPQISVIQIDPNLAAAGGWSDTGDTIELQNSADDISANSLVVNNTNGSVQVKGNFSVDESTLYVDENTNRVGIGTGSPDFALDVVGSINATALNLTGSIQLGQELHFRSQGYIRDTGSDLRVIPASNFIVTNSGNSAAVLTVNSATSNVGIGTQSPVEKLVVIGNVNISGTLNVSGRIAFPNLASCDTIDTDANGVLTCGTDSTTGNGAVEGSGNVGNLTYWISGAAVGNSTLYDNSGNIGIGDETPDALLDVEGTFNANNSLEVTSTDVIIRLN